MAGEAFFPQGQPEVKLLLAALGLGEKKITEVDFHLHLASEEIATVRLSYKELIDVDRVREVTHSLQPFEISKSHSVEVVRERRPEETNSIVASWGETLESCLKKTEVG